MKALVVDDSVLARNMLAAVLDQAGFSAVDHAADGREAIQQVENNAYDVVLLDWNMPNMLGLDALKEIRSLGKQMPVIMVTSISDSKRVQEAIEAGANGYVLKPFKPDDLIEKVRDALPGQAA